MLYHYTDEDTAAGLFLACDVNPDDEDRFEVDTDTDEEPTWWGETVEAMSRQLWP